MRWTQKRWVRDELARRRTAQMRIEVFKIGMRNSNFEVFFRPALDRRYPRDLARSSLNHIVDARRKNERQLEAGPGKEV